MAETIQIARQGSGLPLVLIHGWGLNSAVWQPLSEKLVHHYEVIRVDLPGFGQNIEHSLSPYSIDNIAQQIVAAVNQPAVYIGWSLGGLVASKISSVYPEQSLGLVSVASSPLFIAKDEWPGIKPELLAGFHQQLANDIRKTIDGFLKIQAMGSPHIRQDIKVLRSLIMQQPTPSRATLDDSLALLETVDLRNSLALIKQPFLRLYGRLDTLVPERVSALVSELAPMSEQHVFDKASHAPFISHPEAFLDTVNAWLKQKFD